MAHALPPELLALLAGATFPMTTEQLADLAREHGASEELLAQIRFTPDHIFSSPADLALTLGLLDEFEGAESLWPAAAPAGDMPSPEETAIHVTETEGEGAAP